MINALCIDLEHWYSSEFLAKYLPRERIDQVTEAAILIIKLLNKYGVRSTFFVLGTVAEQHPELVKSIFEQGHEIASHSYSHRTLHDLGQKGFEKELTKSIDLLVSITGERPIGFRAPSFSLDNSTKWALSILKEHGFKYDASIFPIKTMLYGVPKAPLHPYKPSMDDITKEDPNGAIIEFPMTVLRLGVNIPVAGGFYLRALPFWFLRFAIKKVGEVRPAIIYIHPWETYSQTPRLKNIPLFSKFVTYYGSGSALKKFDRLLGEFSFRPVKEVLRLA